MRNYLQFHYLYCLGALLLLVGCSKDQESAHSYSDDTTIPLSDRSITYTEGLKDVATFPVGNVWSGGHPTWGNRRGTDLGGPGDVFERNAYGILSTIKHKKLDVTKEEEVLRTEFNSITPEMALKMHNMWITPDSIDFSEADAMMAFAEANGHRVHGHVILFDKSVPQWALDDRKNNVRSEAEWKALLEDYVDRVVGRYKGRIASWDVLNEIGSSFGPKKDIFWNKVAGEDVVERVFKQVESIDPDALLFVNDNYQEILPAKNRTVVEYANDLRAKGCKVDGIGYQFHAILPATQTRYHTVKSTLELAADAGYLVHISEFDISVNLTGVTWYQTEYQHRVQRCGYNNVARAYMDAVPADQRFGITFWNISDQNSFLNLTQFGQDTKLWSHAQDYPLLWDNDYRRKPAYYGFKNGLRGIAENWFYPPINSTNFTSSPRQQSTASARLSLEDVEKGHVIQSDAGVELLGKLDISRDIRKEVKVERQKVKQDFLRNMNNSH